MPVTGDIHNNNNNNQMLVKLQDKLITLGKEVVTEFSNYRPISLLTSFSKINEKIIFKRLYNYLRKNYF